MARRRNTADPDVGPGASVWATHAARELLFELAAAERRPTKVILERAVNLYADHSEDWRAWVKQQRKKVAA